MKKEYIERSGVLATLAQIGEYPWTIFEDAYGVVQDAPAEDVVPVKHGYWREYGIGYGMSFCSECEYNGEPTMKWCPDCGAKMDGKKESTTK